MKTSITKIYKDHLGRSVSVKEVPGKIISLVPSQTEYLAELGLEDEIAGITKFCIHPGNIFKSKVKVGGTKKISFEKIKQINPDLIICNKEENTKEEIEELMKLYPVWVSDIKTLEGSFDMMATIGEITGKQKTAFEIIKEIKYQFTLLAPVKRPLKVAYLIWKNPLMVAGPDNMINHLLEKANFINVFKNHPLRYPVVTPEEINHCRPDIIFLSSEPYPFTETHIPEFIHGYSCTKALVVDGEMFTWYGSRLRLVPSYINSLIKTRLNS